MTIIVRDPKFYTIQNNVNNDDTYLYIQSTPVISEAGYNEIPAYSKM